MLFINDHIKSSRADKAKQKGKNELSKKEIKIIKKCLDDTKKMLKSKELICACYLYKFEYENDIQSYQKFFELFSSLTVEEMRKMYQYYLGLSLGNKNNESLKGKEKKIK